MPSCAHGANLIRLQLQLSVAEVPGILVIARIEESVRLAFAKVLVMDASGIHVQVAPQDSGVREATMNGAARRLQSMLRIQVEVAQLGLASAAMLLSSAGRTSLTQQLHMELVQRGIEVMAVSDVHVELDFSNATESGSKTPEPLPIGRVDVASTEGLENPISSLTILTLVGLALVLLFIILCARMQRRHSCCRSWNRHGRYTKDIAPEGKELEPRPILGHTVSPQREHIVQMQVPDVPRNAVIAGVPTASLAPATRGRHRNTLLRAAACTEMPARTADPTVQESRLPIRHAAAAAWMLPPLPEASRFRQNI